MKKILLTATLFITSFLFSFGQIIQLVSSNKSELKLTTQVIASANLAASSCSTPSGLKASIIGSDFAKLNWSAVKNANNYTLQYKLIIDTLWTTISTNNTEATLTGLKSAATYQWRVKVNCTIGSSNFANANFITTKQICYTPINLVASAINSVSATVKWNEIKKAVNYTLEYKLTSDNAWQTIITEKNSVNLTNLQSAATYKWRVKANCSEAGSDYANGSFKTLKAVCNNPAYINAISVGSVSATLVWAKALQAVNYTFEYKAVEDTNWITSTTIDTSMLLNELNNSTTYNVRVKTNCSNFINISFINTTFTTNTSNCFTPYNLHSFIASNVATLDWTKWNNDIGYTIQYKQVTDNVWKTIDSTPSIDYSYVRVNAPFLQPATTYDWRVRANCASDTSSFAISKITTQPANECPGVYDTAFNNTFITAQTIPVNTNINGLIYPKNQDVDFYKFTATTNGEVDIILTNNTGVLNGSNINFSARTVNVSLLDSMKTYITSVTSDVTSQSMHLALLKKGTYYLHVTPNTDSSPWAGIFSSGTCYTLNVQIKSYPLNCYPPMGLVCIAANTVATLYWDTVRNATDYTVEYKLNKDTVWNVAHTSSTSLKITVYPNDWDNKWQWRVKPTCASGTSAYTASEFSVSPYNYCKIYTSPYPSPTATAISNNTIRFSWYGGSSAVNYIVEYKLATDTMWQVAKGSIKLSQYGREFIMNVNGFIPSTVYNWRLTAVCESGTQIQSTIFKFTTPLPMQCPGMYDATINNTFTSAQKIPTGINVKGQISAADDVDYYAFSINHKTKCIISLGELRDIRADYDIALYNSKKERLAFSEKAGWENEVININLLDTGTYFIKVAGYNGDYNENICYTLNTTLSPICEPPYLYAYTYIDSADIRFYPVINADKYIVDIKPTSDSNWVTWATLPAATDLNQTFTVPKGGLTSATSYDYRIKAYCTNDGDTSNYAINRFITESCISTSLINISLGSNSAYLTWYSIGYATNYLVEYKQVNEQVWKTAETATTNYFTTLYGLTSSTTYDWRVKVKCIKDYASEFFTSQFTTRSANSCPGIYDTILHNTFATAQTIPINTDIYGLISKYGDEDYYKFVITENTSDTITITNLYINQNIKLYDSAQKVISTNFEYNRIIRNLKAGAYYIKVTSGSRETTDTASICYTLKITTPVAARTKLNTLNVVAMNINEKAAINIYPNPAQKILNVFTPRLNIRASISVLDINGKILINQKTTTSNTALDVHTLANGVYFIKISDANGNIIYHTKFIKL